jgi:hypothetical protein
MPIIVVLVCVKPETAEPLAGKRRAWKRTGERREFV